VSEDPSVRFDAIPKFEPECFASIRNVAVDKSKRFHRGMKQLEEEGAIQLLVAADGARRDIILAAVGELQFDVVVSRLESEYGVAATIERLPYAAARWVVADSEAIANGTWPYQGVPKLHDGAGRLIMLFRSQRDVDYCVERNPSIEFRRLG
jgi:peptide chain release factor 3